jgi:NADPH-dependent 2,4-dienoyl-CoA reductase/sulfur reductase-like enzyme/nitrite reductase/ring-hydroxylating ferredoxin subunit
MAQVRVLSVAELPPGEKKTVKVGETEILLIHHVDHKDQGSGSGLLAVQAKCPHAGAPLEKGAVCNGRLICPWHMGTFALPGGNLLEPPAMSPLKTYAVRIAGDDILVDLEPLPSVSAPGGQTREEPVILLVGSGAAGAMAAVTLRQEGFGGRIVAVDPVAEEPVDRTQLTKQALSGKMPIDKVSLGAFVGLQVERIHASVVSLSAAEGVAHLSQGSPVRFDSALVATGATAKRLAVPGAELAHVIRHADDVRRILAAAEGKQTAVLIGTSFIGLEAASALTQKGLQVTVVGRETRPFANKFGEEVARVVKALHESKGTGFRLGVEIVAVSPVGVTVRVADLEELVAADLVIMGVGVEPELGFEHDLPVAAEGGGIAVDASLQAAARLWVAGDIANVEGTRIEHWRLAEQHGRVAALAMLGAPGGRRYEGVPFFWTTHYGKRFGYLGHAREWDEIVVDGEVTALDFVALYVKDGRVPAILTCGRDTQTAMLCELMRAGLTLEDARRALA